ncbi:MAG: ATP-binding protein [Candidatus Azobacteroides sp.]|nr:ATP-binding protein [Candidatus Azobacteroides sp.]
MKTNYKQKLFLCFVVIFALFTVGIVFLEQTREKEYKTSALEDKLDNYADIVNVMLEKHPNNLSMIDSLVQLFPSNFRLTLIDRQGNVFYDNKISDIKKMENHSGRAEIIAARKTGKGSDIRVSASNEKKYLYYAKQFTLYYVRVALPYDIQVRQILKPDNLFLYYILALFIVILLIINAVASRFGLSIRSLRDFAKAAEQGNLHTQIHFPQDELGEIGAEIIENYRNLKESKKEIDLEREKLLQHVLISEEGLCFFSSDKTVEFYNGLFIQYLNIIIDEANSNPAVIFTDPAFVKVISFLSRSEKQENYFETQINKQGKTFAVRLNRFDDRSFEITLNDITKKEATRRMKQEMTGNITHELRTPVTGIRGCLETILEHPLDPEKKQYFIERAYNQVLALSEIIQDMGLLTGMEEAPQSFKLESVSISELLENLRKDLEIQLQEKNIRMEWNTENVIVRGNHNLLYSIFRNLTDNVIRHAGANVNIFVNKYNEDKDFYYFSYSDTGRGISGEQHLNRLFERFYRVSEGRTRDTGGSGLGLSIVKNAISFHKGTIVAKNKPDGGLEFLFNLPKR